MWRQSSGTRITPRLRFKVYMRFLRNPIFTLILVLLSIAMTLPAHAQTQVTSVPFGKLPDGTSVEMYTLKSSELEIRILTYGGIIQSIKAPDRKGEMADVVLGFDAFEPYIANRAYFGAIVGRYANRVGHAKFSLDGKSYSLYKNDADNTLHGGKVGFNKAVWKAGRIDNGIELAHVSPDGDEGFPGTLTATVRYTLSGKELHIETSATTDKPTVINLSYHSYFNLSGEGHGDILHDEVQINASRYTPVDASLIPTGMLSPVAGTPFDFRKPTEVGARIAATDEQLARGRGYDHNWVLDHPAGEVALAAEVFDPASGRVLDVLTDQPGIQFYSGNFLDGSLTGKNGHVYQKRFGLCLETQHFPDSPNHPSFPSTELRPGQRFHTVTIYKFSTRN
jgi:aldose 1-epimerase